MANAVRRNEGVEEGQDVAQGVVEPVEEAAGQHHGSRPVGTAPTRWCGARAPGRPRAAPRVAAGDAPAGQPQAPPGAVDLDRLEGVGRAARPVPAVGEPGGRQGPVQPDGGAQRPGSARCRRQPRPVGTDGATDRRRPADGQCRWRPVGSAVLGGQGGQCFAYGGSQLSIGQRRRPCVGPDEVGAGTEQWPGFPGDCPQPAPDPVAHHRAAGRPADRVGDPGRFGRVTWHPGYRDRPPPHSGAGPPQGLEGGPVANRPDQADSLARPLRRRADRMARPADGRHPVTEPVALGPLPVVRLECSLHPWPPRRAPAPASSSSSDRSRLKAAAGHRQHSPPAEGAGGHGPATQARNYT